MCVYTIKEIADIVKPIAEQYGVKKMYLFGSYARGEATEDSDVDFRIDKGSLKGLFSLSGLRISISEALDKDVDLLTTNSLSDDFINEIKDDEVLIYEQE